MAGYRGDKEQIATQHGNIKKMEFRNPEIRSRTTFHLQRQMKLFLVSCCLITLALLLVISVYSPEKHSQVKPVVVQEPIPEAPVEVLEWSIEAVFAADNQPANDWITEDRSLHLIRRSVNADASDDIIFRADEMAGSGSGSGSGSGETDTTTAETVPTTKLTTAATTATTTAIAPSSTATNASVAPPVTTTTASTTATETTTEPVAATDLSLIFIVVAAIGGLLIGALLMAAAIYFCNKKRKKSSYDLDASPEAEPKSFTLMEASTSAEPLQHLSAKEDLLKDAMGSGSIAVLEFAIKQATATGMFLAGDALVQKAQTKLNDWRRAHTKLQSAYNSKDLTVMEEYKQRFEDLDIKDESGVHAKASKLLDDRKSLKIEMRQAADLKNEMALVTSTDGFKKLKLPAEYVANDIDYVTAQRELDLLRKDKWLQGRSHDEMKLELRAATASRDKKKITDLLKNFRKAQIPDAEDDEEKAKQVLKDIELDEHVTRDAAWQKMMDASATRDAIVLREALNSSVRSGVAEADIREAERLLKTVEREDQLLHQMRELMVHKDASKMVEAIAVFKTPGLHLVDKSGDIKRAEDLVERMRNDERMERAKGDAMWRLHTARSVGDVDAMDGMIKALEGLASAGMEIDEAMLLRAKTELETMRGRIDYRTRIESIKSAIGRAVKSENLVQLEDLIDQMVELSAKGGFTMTADDSRVLNQSRDVLHDLKRKHALTHEIETTRPALQVPLLPGMVAKLERGVETMTRLKESAAEFPDIFTPADEELLQAASINAVDLRRKTEKMKAAQHRLTAAEQSRAYLELAQAIAQAEEAPFIESSSLVAPRKLAAFLDPQIRVGALKTALASRNIQELAKALEDFRSARVPDESALEAKAERTMDKLKKLEKKRQRAEQKRKRDAERKQVEIDELNSKLQTAIESRNIFVLQEALDMCENSGYEDEEIPLFASAEGLFEKLTIDNLRSRMLEGIERRDIQQLESAIDDADYGGYVSDLDPEYSSAKDLLYDLRELHMLRDKVAGMDRSLISEIQRYRTPPPVVHRVMTAVLTLLGEKQQKASEWLNIQSIVGRTGKDSMARRVRRNAPGDVSLALCDQIDSIIGNLTVGEANAVSTGAGTFLAWMACTIKEARNLHYTRQAREGTEDSPRGSLSTDM